MPWIKFKKLNVYPEHVHRVASAFQEILFDENVNEGLVLVKNKKDMDRILRSGNPGPDYEIALNKYGIDFDDEGWEKEPEIPGVVEGAVDGESEPESKDNQPKARGSNRGRPRSK